MSSNSTGGTGGKPVDASNEAPTRSLWHNPQSRWQRPAPEMESFLDPNVTADELREAVRADDARTEDFSSALTAEALTYTFG